MLLLCALIMIASLFSAQTFVVGEVFTQLGCAFCLPARSALRTMAENYEGFYYLIPLIWQGDANASPNFQERYNLYGVQAMPLSMWGGNLPRGGGGETLLPDYISRYMTVVERESPLTMAISSELQGSNLTVAVDVEVLNNITTENNKFLFILTYDWGDDQPGSYDGSVVRYHEQNFNLLTAGQSDTFKHTFELAKTWEHQRINVIAIVQTFSDDRKVLQAAMEGKEIMQPPANVTLVSPEDNSIVSIRSTLAWETPVSGYAPTRYLVQISATSDFDSLVLNQTVMHPETTFTVPQNIVLNNNRQYFWRIIARNYAGNAIAPHPTWTFTTEDGPAPPTDLNANQDGFNVVLNWQPPVSENIIGYRVFRNGNLLTLNPITELTFTNHNVSSGIYNYSLTALSEKGESVAVSVEITVYAAFPPPRDLTHEVNGRTVTLFWESSVSSRNLLGYRVLRGSSVISTSLVQDLTFTESDVSVGVHTYSVIAVYTLGESEPSTITVEIGLPRFRINPEDGGGFGTWGLTNPTPPNQGFIITNIGGDGLIINDIKLLGEDSEHFLLFGFIELPINLNSNQMSGFTVRFTPKTEGLKEAYILILTNTIEDGYKIQLSGTAVNLAPPHRLFPEITNRNVTLNWEFQGDLEHFLGFDVYRHGNKLNESLIHNLRFTDRDVPIGVHLYSVIAVYRIGLSEPVTVLVEVDDTSNDDLFITTIETALLGNFPNPFNPMTTIRFIVGAMSSSPEKSGHGDMSPTEHVMINVFNVRGQKVRRLVNEEFPAGEYSVIWDGTDDLGQAVSSGVYFYRMTAGEHQSVRRLVLVK